MSAPRPTQARQKPSAPRASANEEPHMPVLPTTPNQDGVRIEPADSPSSHALLTVCVTVVVVAGLYVGRSVLIPITLAVLLSFLLAPLVALLRRLYLGRVPS